MSVIIVGHGPSAFETDHNIDSYDTVIRLKQAQTGGTLGTKTYAIVATKSHWYQEGIPFWQFADKPAQRAPHKRIDTKKWLNYYESFKPREPKPSTGLCAMFAVKEFLEVDEITLVGFDVMRDCPADRVATHNGGDPFTWWHDFRSERKAADELFKHITFL